MKKPSSGPTTGSESTSELNDKYIYGAFFHPHVKTKRSNQLYIFSSDHFKITHFIVLWNTVVHMQY